jgi:hypothetical protein
MGSSVNPSLKICVLFKVFVDLQDAFPPICVGEMGQCTNIRLILDWVKFLGWEMFRRQDSQAVTYADFCPLDGKWSADSHIHFVRNAET